MPISVELTTLAAAGLLAGLGLLVRGFGGYRDAARIADTSTSRIATLAVGEVRVSGVVEPAEVALVSPLQSVRSVFYRSSIEEQRDDSAEQTFAEERSVGFRVRDDTGSVRVFPRGARFEVPVDFESSSDGWDEAVGLNRRTGGAYDVGEPGREAQIAALLTVRQPTGRPDLDDAGSAGGFGLRGSFGLSASGAVSGSLGLGGAAGSSRRRTYREARLEPGDVVTVVGLVVPFDQLPDPTGADLGGDVLGGAPTADPEIAADLAAARAAGTLAASPEEAWGNAAIPGFGIGRPVRAPELDAEATEPPLASVEEAARTSRTFDIGPHDLVLAASVEVPLVIASGSPGEAAGRHEWRFLAGLAGAVLSIGSAVLLAAALSGVLP